MKVKVLWQMIKATAVEWDKDKCPRLGAALSYYTLFSMAPILIIAIAIAGMIFGEEAARGQIVSQLQGLVGTDGAKAIQTMLENARYSSDNILATIIGIVMLLVGATGAFVELQDSLNTVWEVTPRPGQGIIRLLTTRLLSFGIVVGVGFLLLVSLVISAALSALGSYLGDFMPGATLFWQIINQVISFAVVAFLFAMIYKILPDVTITWKDVWIGAIVTAVLFTLGKYLIGLYLGNSGVASTYGAAGSLVALLVWIYYSSQILLFGAEFTQVYAERFGTRIRPTSIAISVADVMCDREDAKELATEIADSKEKEEEEVRSSESGAPSRGEEEVRSRESGARSRGEEEVRSSESGVRSRGEEEVRSSEPGARSRGEDGGGEGDGKEVVWKGDGGDGADRGDGGEGRVAEGSDTVWKDPNMKEAEARLSEGKHDGMGGSARDRNDRAPNESIRTQGKNRMERT